MGTKLNPKPYAESGPSVLHQGIEAANMLYSVVEQKLQWRCTGMPCNYCDMQA